MKEVLVVKPKDDGVVKDGVRLLRSASFDEVTEQAAGTRMGLVLSGLFEYMSRDTRGPRDLLCLFIEAPTPSNLLFLEPDVMPA
jgi:hypothetical protein